MYNVQKIHVLSDRRTTKRDETDKTGYKYVYS